MTGTVEVTEPRERVAHHLSVSRGTRIRRFLEPRSGAISLATVLLLVAVVVLRGVTKGEFNLGVDEAHHAFTGLFLADFLRDLPLAHPVHYAYLYYAQYPALGLIHWPPFFYLVEGISFLLLGPSVVAARLTVLLFALVGFYFWFMLVRELENEWAATASTAIVALLPWLLLYEKAVMLEVPAMALCIVATYCWVLYLRRTASRYLYWFAFFAGLALLTKQQSIYLATFCALTILAERKWRLILNWNTLRALGITLLMAGPFYALVFGVHYQAVAAAVFQGHANTASAWTYYLRHLPRQLGSPLLTLSVLGIVTWRWREKRQNAVIMLVWMAACYLTFSSLALKEPRYNTYWIPPFVYFAVAPLTTASLRRWMRPIAVSILLVLVGGEFWSGWRYERPYLSGYSAIARWLADQNHAGIILDDEDLTADLCFYLRADDPARRYVVMRKALYAVDNGKEFRSIELVHTKGELDNIVREYGVRYILVDNSPVDFEIQTTLRDFLHSPQFRLAETFPIESNMRQWQGRKLFLYENTRVVPPTAKLLRLKMLTLTYDIVVPLDQLVRP